MEKRSFTDDFDVDVKHQVGVKLYAKVGDLSRERDVFTGDGWVMLKCWAWWEVPTSRASILLPVL